MRKICLSHCQKAAAILRSSEPTYTSQPTLDEDAKLLLYTRAVFIIPGHGVGAAASHTHPCAASARAPKGIFFGAFWRARGARCCSTASLPGRDWESNLLNALQAKMWRTGHTCDIVT